MAKNRSRSRKRSSSRRSSSSSKRGGKGCTLLKAAEKAAASGSCDRRREAVEILRNETSRALASKFVSKKEKERLYGKVQHLEARAAICGRVKTVGPDRWNQVESGYGPGGGAQEGLLGLGFFGL